VTLKKFDAAKLEKKIVCQCSSSLSCAEGDLESVLNGDGRRECRQENSIQAKMAATVS